MRTDLSQEIDGALMTRNQGSHHFSEIARSGNGCVSTDLEEFNDIGSVMDDELAGMDDELAGLSGTLKSRPAAALIVAKRKALRAAKAKALNAAKAKALAIKKRQLELVTAKRKRATDLHKRAMAAYGRAQGQANALLGRAKRREEAARSMHPQAAAAARNAAKADRDAALSILRPAAKQAAKAKKDVEVAAKWSPSFNQAAFPQLPYQGVRGLPGLDGISVDTGTLATFAAIAVGGFFVYKKFLAK